jgi:hypothetical protein
MQAPTVSRSGNVTASSPTGQSSANARPLPLKRENYTMLRPYHCLYHGIARPCRLPPCTGHGGQFDHRQGPEDYPLARVRGLRASHVGGQHGSDRQPPRGDAARVHHQSPGPGLRLAAGRRRGALPLRRLRTARAWAPSSAHAARLPGVQRDLAEAKEKLAAAQRP